MSTIQPILALLLSFIAGSLPTGLLLGKMKGIDIRTIGSGNVGATNTFRALGAKWGVFCLLVDILKGLAPVLLFAAPPWRPEAAWLTLPVWKLIVGFSAIAGHSFSPWLKFKGGKGVATSVGALFGIQPIAMGILFATGVGLILATGYVALASVVGAALLPFLIILFPQVPEGHGRPWPVIIMSFLLAAFVIWKHRPNIQRLRSGTENRILYKKKTPSPAETEKA